MSKANTLLNELSPDQIKAILADSAHGTGIVFFVFDTTGDVLLSSSNHDESQNPSLVQYSKILDTVHQVTLSTLKHQKAQSADYCLTEVIQYQGQLIGILVGWFNAQSPESLLLPFIKALMRTTRSRIETLISSQSEMDSLSAEILEKYRELGLLDKLSRELAGLSDIEQIYYIVLSEVIEAVEGDYGYIFKLDPSTGVLHCMQCYPETIDASALGTIPLGEGLIGKVVETGESILIDDITNPMWSQHKNLFNTPPLICCALQIGPDPLGVIIVSRSKPRKFFMSSDLKILKAAALQSVSAMMNVTLLEDLKRFQGELEDSYQQTLLAMTSLLELRHQETENHSIRVVEFALRIAKEMGITDPHQIDTIKLGATLHDIGKIGVSDTILLKPGRFTDEERTEMQKHTIYGYKVLENIPFVGDAALIVLHHHENYDGTGYPMGLKGKEIPLGARIFKAADVFDALASRRPYKEPWSYQQIREEFIKCKGSDYDPKVVEAFLRIPEEEWEAIRAQSRSLSK